MGDPTLNLAQATRLRDHLIARHQADLAAARRIRTASLALCAALAFVAGGAVGILGADQVLPAPEPVVVEVCDGR